MGEYPSGFGGILTFIQVFFAVIIGLYFWNLLKAQHGSKSVVEKESRKEMEKLQRLRSISLTEPLSEKTRPTSFKEIIGQAEGLKSLRAALCGPNPQHHPAWEKLPRQGWCWRKQKTILCLLLKKTPSLLNWMQIPRALMSGILPIR